MVQAEYTVLATNLIDYKFLPKLFAGIVGNFLGVPLFVDLKSDVEERSIRSGVLPVGGTGSDLGNTTDGFTVTSPFICFVNPWYL